MNKIKIYIAGSLAIDWTKHQEKGGARQYAEEDLKGLKECDCLVYCMDSNHSRGKNFELGYITALGKPVVIYIIPSGESEDTVSEDRSHIDSLIDKECIFIRAKLYPILNSIDELRLWLDNLEIKLLLSKTRQKQVEV